MYLDGQWVAEQSLGVHSTGNALPLEIGRQGPVAAKYWQGEIDDVRVWNVVRTSAQVNAAFNSQLNSSQPGLIANWHFDEGCGSTAQDVVGTHVATLSGAVAWAVDVPGAPADNAAQLPISASCPGGG
jgi:hypothetical protein